MRIGTIQNRWASPAWVATTSAVLVVGLDPETLTRQKSIGLAYPGATRKIKTEKMKSYTKPTAAKSAARRRTPKRTSYSSSLPASSSSGIIFDSMLSSGRLALLS